MITKEELMTPENLAAQKTDRSRTDEGVSEAGRRSFVEPEISVPVDVLEATTFFQGLTSGITIP